MSTVDSPLNGPLLATFDPNRKPRPMSAEEYLKGLGLGWTKEDLEKAVARALYDKVRCETVVVNSRDQALRDQYRVTTQPKLQPSHHDWKVLLHWVRLDPEFERRTANGDLNPIGRHEPVVWWWNWLKESWTFLDPLTGEANAYSGDAAKTGAEDAYREGWRYLGVAGWGGDARKLECDYSSVTQEKWDAAFGNLPLGQYDTSWVQPVPLSFAWHDQPDVAAPLPEPKPVMPSRAMRGQLGMAIGLMVP